MNKNLKPVVLIVDDNSFNLRIIEGTLKDDYRVLVASNGEEALNIATANPKPDLILLDVMMPEIDGFQVCSTLKELAETRDIPVIFVTALSKESDEEMGLKTGAIDYIIKPFSIPILKARVKNHIELKKLRDLIKENSMLDGLTNIANKKKFNDALEAEWIRGMRYGEPLSIFIIDIDYFKKYNDTYGHLEGDECLKVVAHTLKTFLKRGTDLVARWGGEEFACILPRTGQAEALKVAKELCSAIESLKIPHETSKVSDYVTVSIGVATMFPKPENFFLEIVNRSDRALYIAKQRGRNRVEDNF